MHLVAGINEKSQATQAASALRTAQEGGVWGWLLEQLVTLCGGFPMGAGRVGARRMKVLETLSIGPRKQLVLVSCDGETYLIGTGPETVQAIQRVDSRVGDRSFAAHELGERS